MVFGPTSNSVLGAYPRMQSVYLVTFYSIAGVISHVPYIPPLFTAITGKRSPLVSLGIFCRRRALERLRMGATRKDLFYYLVSSRTELLASSSHRTQWKSGEELPETERPLPAEVVKDGLLAIIAGADTTSSVITAALYHLLRNPVAYKELQAEVDGAFSSGEEPLDVMKLSQMEWLNGCM